MNRDLIDACGMFLTPATILFAAIGIAQTEGLKAGISFIGFGISLVWLLRVLFWTGLKLEDWLTGLAFAGIFLAVAFVSFVVHGRAWLRNP